MKLVGAGREAEVFEWGPGRVLRLARSPSMGPVLDRERAALHAARGAGAPVPIAGDRVEVDGRPGLVLERLDGEDLLTTVTRRPWRAWAVARTLGAIHAALHEVVAPEAIPELRAALRGQLESDLVPEDVRARALERLERLPDGDRLCHGDFHPGNLLPGRNGPVVIDWTMAARGDPAADVARTRVLLSGAVPGDLPPGVAALLGTGRRILERGYLREYGRRRGLDLDAVAGWELVWAAARLAENIPEERAALLRRGSA